ncbi:MAG: GMP/IMP nucleotidase [Gammaproteobacteria bacterium]|nr:GMP/IMP nucleotidase [Gammaproteobacteria bacterium]
MIDWEKIRTVLLDMDGTLLDLHFDNHFWQEHLPQRYAEKHGIGPNEARTRLHSRFEAMQGTLDWYCVDYWSRELDLDITLLKLEVAHLIAIHPHVTDFLDAVRASRRRAVLVTNAHHKSLELKMRCTRLGARLDAVISAHTIGIPKENPAFWRHLQRIEPFDPAHTLLIDDNLAVLASARACGIAHLLAVRSPDSRAGPKLTGDFPALHGFRDILPPLDGAGKG